MKKTRPKKNIIILLVEGQTDRLALERPLNEILSNANNGLILKTVQYDSDIFADKKYKYDVSKRIIEVIKEKTTDEEYIYPKDICRIVHLTDLDGAFIPDEYCKDFDYFEDYEIPEKGFVYRPPYIHGPTIKEVIERNERKRERTMAMLDRQEIKYGSKTITYDLYFFSANFDHYLYNLPNYEISHEKVENAKKFADESVINISSFLNRFSQDQWIDYASSWDFITSDVNSIERHTNFNLFLQSLF